MNSPFTDPDTPNVQVKSLFSWMPADTEAQKVLNLRAEYLQRPNKNEAFQAQLSPYVRFRLGAQEQYGVPFEFIEEVMLNVVPTKVPNTVDYIVGVINRQGVLISMIDLKLFFHLKSIEEDAQPHLIVVRTAGMTVALLADTIIGSDNYDARALDMGLITEGAIKPKFILGLHAGTTAILNIEALLIDLHHPKTLS